jgi:IS30 family transposase
MKNPSYEHISADERDQIAHWYNAALSLSDIAGRLGRHKSSISREIQRNKSTVFEVYHAHKAHVRAEERAKKTHQRPRLKHRRIRHYVETKLKLGWPPEQIAGRLPIDHRGFTISMEAIYQYIYDSSVRKHSDYVPLLTRRHERRQRKGHRKTHKSSHIPLRVDILQRPRHIAKRQQCGHWEADAVISRQSPAAINVTCERKSRYTFITKMNQKSAPQTVRAITKSLRCLPGKVRRTLTYDNGSENVEHDTINHQLGTRSYFCQPYRSWEKGTVENTIGLVRRRYPKKTDFAKISQRQLSQLQYRLNTRPRKCLSFRTPNEIFQRCCT